MRGRWSPRCTRPDGYPGRERPRPRGVRAIGGASGSVLPGRPASATALGEARRCVEAGRARDQAPSSRGAVRAVRPRARGTVRARARTPAARADPCRPRDPDDRARRAGARPALPVGGVDPRARRDLRSQLDLARGATSPQPVLRYGLVALDRSGRAVRTDPAGPDPVRQRPAVLHPDADRHVRDPDSAPGRPGRRPAAGNRRAASSSGCSSGKDPLDLGPAVGGRRSPPSILLERVNAMLLLAVSRMLLGDTGYEPLALARLACDIGADDAPETEVCRSVLALLELQGAQRSRGRRVRRARCRPGDARRERHADARRAVAADPRARDRSRHPQRVARRPSAARRVRGDPALPRRSGACRRSSRRSA